MLLFRNGDTYSGEYFADRMHGFGVYKFGNGHRYEGAWHEGTRQGLGMYSFRNGETQAGHWQNGVLDIATSPTTVPTSPYGVSYSKVLTAVQVYLLFLAFEEISGKFLLQKVSSLRAYISINEQP